MEIILFTLGAKSVKTFNGIILSGDCTHFSNWIDNLEVSLDKSLNLQLNVHHTIIIISVCHVRIGILISMPMLRICL